MTLRIYYTDAYRRTFDAVVIRTLTAGVQPAVVLDRTAFYPTSGGQPFDTGVLGTARVMDVIDQDDGSVAHVLDRPVPGGARVEGAIDWPRRFDHMQQHTGQHVLSAAFARLSDHRTLSFHMGAEVSTIDLAKEAPPDAIAEAEAEANRIVWEDRAVSIRFVSPEEAASLALRKEPSREGTLRLVEIAEFDLSACGGTHVSRTGGIGVIAVSGWERFRGGTRVTFVCGRRALRLFGMFRDAIAGSVRSLSVLPAELPSAIERLQNDARDLRRSIKSMQEALASHEAARLTAGAPVVNGVRIVAEALEGWDAAGLKAIAVSAASRDAVAVMLCTTTRPVSAVIARSRDVNVDAQAVLKGLMAQFSGRGGGKPDLAQAGGFDADPALVAGAAEAALRENVASRTTT